MGDLPNRHFQIVTFRHYELLSFWSGSKIDRILWVFCFYGREYFAFFVAYLDVLVATAVACEQVAQRRSYEIGILEQDLIGKKL